MLTLEAAELPARGNGRISKSDWPGVERHLDPNCERYEPDCLGVPDFEFSYFGPAKPSLTTLT